MHPRPTAESNAGLLVVRVRLDGAVVGYFLYKKLGVTSTGEAVEVRRGDPAQAPEPGGRP